VNSAEETSPLDGENKVETALESSSAVAREDSMEEYRQLKLELYITTLAIALVVFATVAFVSDLPTAFNYLLGAVASLVYLRMLAKDVDRLGGDNQRLSWNRTALFVGLMVVAAKWHQLQVLPIFLGFLTYKAALLIYLIRTTLLTNLRSS
jgi:ATP synthase protein I